MKMNKEYIESLLKNEKITSQISIMRTQFTHIMSEFYFFNTFFRVLKSLGFEVHHRKESVIVDGKVASFCFIDFLKDNEKYTTEYDNGKLQNDLNNFNEIQGDMSMLESANALIDIFLSLLL
jgi:hypothetical protein